MTTVFDVARLADCSIATVSRVVNRRDGVSSATRERVQLAIKEARYTPHGPARALKRLQTETLGLVVTDIADPVVAELIRGVASRADELGLALFLKIRNAEKHDAGQALQSLLERRVGGVLLDRRPCPEVVDAAAGLEIPLVFMEYPFSQWENLTFINDHDRLVTPRASVSDGHAVRSAAKTGENAVSLLTATIAEQSSLRRARVQESRTGERHD